MSLTLDHTLPAGATPVTLAFSMTRTWPPMVSCGMATLGCRASVAGVAIVSLMPSGSKMRVLITCSQGCPVTASITAPAAAYITFW